MKTNNVRRDSAFDQGEGDAIPVRLDAMKSSVKARAPDRRLVGECARGRGPCLARLRSAAIAKVPTGGNL